MNSGIYQITNTVNGMFYVGSAQDFSDRWNEHRWRLRKNAHHNRHLQFAWNKYGEEAFIFEIVEYSPPEALLSREQVWLDGTGCWDQKVGYNLSRHADAPMRGRKASPETRIKLSKAKGGKPKPLGFGRKISKLLTGIKRSEETRKRISISKMGTPAANKGIAMSADQRQKMSNVRTGTVWLLCPVTSETLLVKREKAVALLAGGWVKCTKAAFRKLKP